MNAQAPVALLMDLDGTIADTLPHLFESFRHAVAPFVARLPSNEEILATFGPAERECMARLLRNPALAPAGAESHLPAADERYHAFYEGGHADRVKPFAGVLEAIHDMVSSGWRFGVFTGKGRRSAVFTLRQLRLLELAQCVVTSDDVARPKPDPEGVLLAARLLGVPPEQLVFVGDTPADMHAGRAAGARTAAALWGAFDREATRGAGPTWALLSPEELVRVLEACSGDSP